VSRTQWIVIGIGVALLAAVTLYGAFRLAKRLFVLRRVLGELGASGKFAFYGALIYTFFPIDILPDPIYLDDMGVLLAAVAYLTHLARKRGVQLPLPRRPEQPNHNIHIKR